MSRIYNPWHGCTKVSPGCKHCYMFRMDEEHGKDPTVIAPTGDFLLPVQKNRHKEWKIPSGETLYTCFTSDFFHKDADGMRQEVWEMIRQRSDLTFLIPTKRIERVEECLPKDWGECYSNVTLACTIENQEMCDKRMPVFIGLPFRHKQIFSEPLLEAIDFRDYLVQEVFDLISVGGESGPDARPCNYNWVLGIRQQCIKSGTPFHFKQTGARFVMNGRTYFVDRDKQLSQAKKANIDWMP